MGRIRQGWELTKKSWAVLRSDPTLLRFPLFGGIATVFFAILVVGPGLYLFEEDQAGIGIPVAIIGLYILALVGYFFSVGLAATANRLFQGQSAEFSDGIADARARLPQIAGWALLALTVGLILNFIAERVPAGGLIARLLDVAWSLITFLAVPVIAIEGTGPVATFKRSGALFRERWGQQITGNVAIGGLVFLLGFLPGAALIAGGVLLYGSTAVAGGVLIGLGVIVVMVALLVGHALSGIFGVALYHYAAEGRALGGFTDAELESAVKPKGGTAPSTV